MKLLYVLFSQNYILLLWYIYLYIYNIYMYYA